MQITVKVRGFRGIERADIEINPIALCAGLNFAGKSSLAQAVAAAVCGTPIPFFRSNKPDKAMLTKTEGKELLRGGMDAGSVEVSVDGTPSCSASWPKQEWSGDGRLQVSKVAAGLINPMDMEDVERQKFFSELLSATPTRNDLQIEVMEKLPRMGDENGGAMLKDFLDLVDVSGWDAVHTSAKEKGARLKGGWEAKSGEAYGSKKAAEWKPKAWRPDLDKVSEEQIATDCTLAEKARDEAVARSAVADSDLLKFEEDAKVEGREYEAYKEAIAKEGEKKRESAKAVNWLNSLHVPSPTPCPHCGGFLDIMQAETGFRVLVSEASKADIDYAKKQYEEARGAAAAAMESENLATAVARKAEAAYNAVKGAAEKLAQAKSRKGSTDDVAVAQDHVRGLLADKEMVVALAECRVLHGRIADNQKLVDILAPEGLRRQKLVKALDKFNKDILIPLCNDADYPVVGVNQDLDILYRGRKYFLLSESEKYRVKSVLQVAIATYDGSPLVIYDGADILDTDGRNGLFQMMSAVDKSFLVCMTFMDQGKVPNLSKMEMGKSYWIDDNIIAQPL